MLARGGGGKEKGDLGADKALEQAAQVEAHELPQQPHDQLALAVQDIQASNVDQGYT